MKNLELKQQILFCEKYKLDANQLLLLEIILIAQEGDDAEIVQLYFQSKAKGSLLNNLIKLQEVGVILKSYKMPGKGERLDLNTIPINKNLVKDFYKCSFELGKELFEVYKIDNGPDYVSDGLFRIVGKNSKIGFADTCGVIVIPPVFSYATPFHNGEAKVSFGGKNEKQGEYQSWDQGSYQECCRLGMRDQ